MAVWSRMTGAWAAGDLHHRHRVRRAVEIAERGLKMREKLLAEMRQSIVDGAPDSAANLARQGLLSGLAPARCNRSRLCARHGACRPRVRPQDHVLARHDGIGRSDGSRP